MASSGCTTLLTTTSAVRTTLLTPAWKRKRPNYGTPSAGVRLQSSFGGVVADETWAADSTERLSRNMNLSVSPDAEVRALLNHKLFHLPE